MIRFLLVSLLALVLSTGCEVIDEPLDGDTSAPDITADVNSDAQVDGSDVPGDFNCEELDCEDGLECTTDSCAVETGCVHELRAEFCLIEGACAENGAAAGDDPCSICSVEDSQDAWTAQADGSACEDGDLCTTGELCSEGLCAGGTLLACDDGFPCTVDTCDQESGECRFDLEPDFCLIDGVCVASGEYEPGSMCAWCQPEASIDTFSFYDGTCDDEDPCTLDDVCASGVCVGEALECGEDLECATFSCVEGACVVDLEEDSCLIEGACYASGETSEDNSCASCQPEFDTEGWNSVKDGDTCEDGDLCTTGEACLAGACEGAEPVDCEDGGECTENWCDEESGECMFSLEDNTCVIDSTCYAADATNPQNSCQLCAPAAAVIVWTDAPDGAPCGNSGTCVDTVCEGDTATGDVCDFAFTVDPESLPTVLEGDNAGFEANYTACGATGQYPDVAYSFTPAVTGIYSLGMPQIEELQGASLVGVTADCGSISLESEEAPQCMLSFDFSVNGGGELSINLEAETTYTFIVSSVDESQVGAYALTLSAPCVPACEEGVCGEDSSDGCGGTCGCDDDQVCVDGACCEPTCDGVTCGEDAGDGCGGVCGCEDGSVCLDDTCCETTCDGTTCGATSDGCEGACVCDEGLFCVLGACEDAAEGQTCEEPFVIDASNLPVTIAGDNTGYSNDYVTCSGSGNQAGDAVYSFTPKASGIYLMGMPGYVSYEHASMLSITTDCGELLLETGGFSPGCVLSHDFINSTGEGVPVELEAETTYYIIIDSYDASEIGPYNLSVSDICTPQCDEISCGGGDGCGGTCGCAEGDTCFEGACCKTSCDGDKCGSDYPDGCGGLCGCDEGQSCFDGSCCEPVCDGVTCGFDSSDGCGGFCGCGDGESCFEGLCCQAQCDGVTCGAETDDGCGGSCGCLEGALCVDGACCTPECSETTCGLNTDGCGGNCECGDGLSCIDGGCYESDQGDNCDDAFEVGYLPFNYSGSTSTAGDAYSVAADVCPNVSSGAGDDAEDQVFVLEAPASGFYSIELTSLWDAALYITTDCANLAESCIGGADNTGGSNVGAVESTVVDLEEGQVIFIIVDGYNSFAQGLFELTISEPCIATCEPGACGANSNGCGGDCGCLEGELCILGQCSDEALGDTCDAPIVIDPELLPLDVSGDNTGYENDYTFCGGFSGDDEPDVAYSLTPSVTGVYSFGMPGYVNAQGASLLGITTDCADLLPGAGSQCLASKDYYGTGGAEFDVTLEAGTTYFIMIDSYVAGEIGPYTFSVSAPCAPTCEEGACGPDGCGGFCGCEEGQACFEGLCCEPLCDGSACGFGSDDGCGGSCGCEDGTTCFEGVCCEPQCDGSACGANSDDTCGGVCGCDEGTSCFEGACCAPSCDGISCGEDLDGCGGSCGCEDGNVCIEGTCSAAAEGDQCSTAFVVTFDDAGNFSFDGDTSDAGSDYGYQGGDCPGETSSWGNASKDEAFLLTATVEGDYVVTLDADFDSNLFAVTDCADVSGSCLGADEQMTVESITLSMAAGETAYVIVDGWKNSGDVSGTYNLTITAP